MGSAVEGAKLRAARRAVEFVEDGMVLGAGSGSTAKLFLRELAERVRTAELEIVVIPTSIDTEILARQLGLRVEHPNSGLRPDLAVDGADVVDSELNLLKGGGGALAREKVVGYYSKELVVVVDWTKLADTLYVRPVPVEVMPFAWCPVAEELKKAIARRVELRMCGEGKVGPVVTDNGNFILDVYVGERDLPCTRLDREIRALPGVVETGIFPNYMVDAVIIGYPDRVEVLER